MRNSSYTFHRWVLPRPYHLPGVAHFPVNKTMNRFHAVVSILKARSDRLMCSSQPRVNRGAWGPALGILLLEEEVHLVLGF